MIFTVLYPLLGMLQKKSLHALMHMKHLLSIATYLYAATVIAEAPSSEAYIADPPSHEASHAEHQEDTAKSAPSHPEHDVHKKDTKDVETSEKDHDDEKDTEDVENSEEDHDDEKDTQEAEHTCAQATPTSPAEEPESKELQQERALYEMNAYFDDYLLPRPFIVGSTEF
jgi:hypothetical protein